MTEFSLTDNTDPRKATKTTEHNMEGDMPLVSSSSDQNSISDQKFPNPRRSSGDSFPMLRSFEKTNQEGETDTKTAEDGCEKQSAAGCTSSLDLGRGGEREDSNNDDEPKRTGSPIPAPKTELGDDEPLCRICLAGRDDEDPSLGRFIQPCLCRGTMAFIHVGCLQRWRISSPSPQSFYRCDQCGYRYKLRRAKVAGLAENNAILGGLTLLVFFILVLLGGFAAGWLVEAYSSRTVIADDSWDYGLGPFWSDSTGKVVGEIVGQAICVLNSKLQVEPVDQSKPRRKHKLNSRPKSEDTSASALEPILLENVNEQEGSNSYRYVKVTRNTKKKGNSESKWEHASESDTSHHPKSSTDEDSGGRLRGFVKGSMNMMFFKFETLLKHTVKGLAFIGIMGSFQFAISVSLFSPWNLGFRSSILRVMRASNRNGGGAGGDPGGTGSLIILGFVVLGIFKAIRGVWRCVRRTSQWALRKVEDGVLDVSA